MTTGNAGGCTTSTSTNVFTHSTTKTPSFSSLLLTNNQIQFSATGEAGAYYIVQATTNLTQPNWISVSTNAAPFTFVDPVTASSAQRFCRVVAP